MKGKETGVFFCSLLHTVKYHILERKNKVVECSSI